MQVFCTDIWFSFLPAERLLPEILFSFLPAEKASARKYYFISCRWEDFCSDIFLFNARGKTSPRRYYFYVLAVERLLPGGVIFFPALDWLLPVSLSPRIKFHPRRRGVHGAVCGCRSPWRRCALPKFLVRGRGTEAALVVVRYLMSRSLKFRRTLSSSSLCCLEYSPIDTCIQAGLFPTFFLALTYSCMIGYLLLFLWQKEGKKVSIVETFLAAPSSKRKKALRFPQSGCSLQRRTHKETPKRITQR